MAVGRRRGQPGNMCSGLHPRPWTHGWDRHPDAASRFFPHTVFRLSQLSGPSACGVQPHAVGAR